MPTKKRKKKHITQRELERRQVQSLKANWKPDKFTQSLILHQPDTPIELSGGRQYIVAQDGSWRRVRHSGG